MSYSAIPVVLLPSTIGYLCVYDKVGRVDG